MVIVLDVLVSDITQHNIIKVEIDHYVINDVTQRKTYVVIEPILEKK